MLELNSDRCHRRLLGIIMPLFLATLHLANSSLRLNLIWDCSIHHLFRHLILYMNSNLTDDVNGLILKMQIFLMIGNFDF